MLRRRRGGQHSPLPVAHPAWRRHRYRGIRGRQGDGAGHRQAQPRSGLPQHRPGIERGDRSDPVARQARLFRLRPAHERSRVGGARARQERRHPAQAANAAGAEEAVRDLRHRPHHAGAQARPSGGDRGADRPRRGAQERLDGILVSAEDRPAQEAARRGRSLRPRPSSAIRHPVAGRVHAGRDRERADRAVRARAGRARSRPRRASPPSASICASPSTSRSMPWSSCRSPISSARTVRRSTTGRG